MKINTLLLLLLIPLLTFADQKPEINVIYGDHHIFTVETPYGWVNDKEFAKTINLVSFFYPKSESDRQVKNHIYAMGYDKELPSENLNDFVEADLKTFKKKYPNVTYEILKTGHSGPIISTTFYSFDNLYDRYKEEVAYMETENTIIVIAFSTYTKNDYQNYLPVFNKFISSFKFRGHDPKPFLDWQKKNSSK